MRNDVRRVFGTANAVVRGCPEIVFDVISRERYNYRPLHDSLRSIREESTFLGGPEILLSRKC